MNNELYVIDIAEKKCLSEEYDAKAVIIIVNRDLIRGFTTSYYIAKEYAKFLKNVIGDYVDIICISDNIPKNLIYHELQEFAFALHEKSRSEIEGLYVPSTLPQIMTRKLHDGNYLICNEYLLSQYDDISKIRFIMKVYEMLNNPLLNYVRNVYTDGLKMIAIEFDMFMKYIDDGLSNVSRYGVMEFGYDLIENTFCERGCRLGLDMLTYMKCRIIKTKFMEREL